MRCVEAREYLFAFLDDELDAPLSMDLQGHLERCPHCAREAEIERAVRQRLEKALRDDCPDVPFEPHRLDELLTRPGRTARPSTRSRLIAATGLAAVLALAAGVWIVLESRGSETFAELVASESTPFLEARGPLHVPSSDRGTVTEWLRASTHLQLALPEPGDPSWKLIGGRRCTLAGRPAAFALYELDGVPASLVALSGDEHEVAGMEPVRHGGPTYFVSRCGDRNVVALPRDGLIYVAVSSLTQTQLFDLLESIEP